MKKSYFLVSIAIVSLTLSSAWLAKKNNELSEHNQILSRQINDLTIAVEKLDQKSYAIRDRLIDIEAKIEPNARALVSNLN